MDYLFFAERNVVVLTQLQASFETTSSERLRDAYESLDGHEKVMFNELQHDVDSARTAIHKLFGSSKLKNGEYRYVLLRRQCQFVREFKSEKVYTSSLVLDEANSLTYDVFMKLIGLLRLAGHVITEPEYHDACAKFDIDYPYFTYNIDFS